MSKADEHVKTTRWLYDSERDYRKAAAKLKLEELKARKEKQLIRQYRRRRRRLWMVKVMATARRLMLKVQSRVKSTSLLKAGSVLVVLGLVSGVVLMFSRWNKRSSEQTKTLGAASVQADFKPALPQDGGQNLRASENNNHKIVSYQTNFEGSKLIISQQKLPDNMKDDPAAISKLDQFKSSESLDTSKGKLYINTNTTGQQWAAIVYEDILIFIQSDRIIGFDSWHKFIQELRVQ